MAAGCGTSFTTGTTFYRSPFFAKVAQVIFSGSTGTTGIVWLLASGALETSFAGRGEKTGGVEAGPEAIYCAMAARR